MPVAVPLIAAGVAAGATVYSVQQQKKMQREAEDAQRSLKPPELPKQPQLGGFATDQQKAQALAMSAGGTILSDQRQNRLGSSPLEPRKSLIGS